MIKISLPETGGSSAVCSASLGAQAWRKVEGPRCWGA
eukprot:COSAG03_NODE_21586_length_302_cov_1.009852_1_plen_36_part_01